MMAALVFNDLFVFASFTALSFVDIKELTTGLINRLVKSQGKRHLSLFILHSNRKSFIPLPKV